MMHSDNDRQRLLKIWRRLDGGRQAALLSYAEFLQQQAAVQPEPSPSQEPLPILRPAEESAVKALKRLKKTYPMIDADAGLLDEASQLLMAKVLGTPDAEVIDNMEGLFRSRYEMWKGEQ